MGLSPSNSHHRRRSSVLTSTAGSSHAAALDQRDDPSRLTGDGLGYKRDDLKVGEDPDVSDLSSIAESVEMDHISSDDDIQDDEETGLTARQRRQRRRRRQQRRQLDARIAGVKASKTDDLAGQSVTQRLLINATLILMWYFFSLAISIYNKWMFSEDDIVFPYPLFTTSLHMLVQFTLASTLLWIFPSLRPKAPPPPDGAEPEPLLTKLFYFTRLVPCGTATSLDIGLGNMSLKFISLTFLTMCKSSALAFVLIFAFLFRLETPSFKLILIIAAMTVGVVMMVAGETAFNTIGFVLVIASAFFSGFRWGLTQILLLRHPATGNPFSTLFFLTPVMFLSLIVIATSIEGPSQIFTGVVALTDEHGGAFAAFLLVFPGVLAFCMIAAEFALLKRSSVVTLSICGIFKEVVTISAAGVIFHDQLTLINLTGLFVTICSIGCYNYMKIAKMRADAQKASWDRTPDLDSDSEDLGPVRTRGGYHQVADQETTMVESPTIHVDDNVNITPPSDLPINGGRSFRVRASGASSAVHGLSINTTNLEDPDKIQVSRPSPMKSAPPIVISADTQFPPQGTRGPSPSEDTRSSPERHHASDGQ
ncbi:putative nucleotide-sugar transporter [Aspergillus candidus]|uniref:Putative nucleotide-sugar transporter n=1 Tax=Aspergillus candidus TaxID=41067 RepID=A0A2I2FKP6_ASPCN|nr:putative nucleotide-sugar transporter [Aspergillus candidus]PLB41182.1 putative nucleotide-sugar transporter [Aspergillus candidus]